MAHAMDIRKKLDELRAEILALRNGTCKTDKSVPPAEEIGGTKSESTLQQLEHQIGELNQMVVDVLNDAETTATQHPIAALAGALALGIVIGRVTAH